MKEYYVSYDCAKRLHELGFDGADKYYVTENFCMGDNPYFFDTFSVGDLVDEHIVYFVNENNEDEYRGIPAPRLDQAAAWLRDKKELHVLPRLENVNKPDYVCIITLMRKESMRITDDGKYFPAYESALSAGIDKALELLTNK